MQTESPEHAGMMNVEKRIGYLFRPRPARKRAGYPIIF